MSHSPSTSAITAAEPELTTRAKAVYFFGYIPDVIMNNVVASLALMIYNVELGVSAGLIGLAISVPRLWEAFTDPVIGTISDNTKSRWGRRRPYVAIGAILAGILCAALWMPPKDLGHNGLFTYFLIVSILYFTAYAIFTVPYLAMGLGMATKDADRTSLMGWRAAANNFTCMAIIPLIPIMVTHTYFGQKPAESVRIVGLILGGAIILMGVTAAILSRERSVAEQPRAHEKLRLGAGLKAVIKNKPFMMVTGIVSLALIGYCIDQTLGYYMNLSIVFPGGTDEAKRQSTELSGACTVGANLLGLIFSPLIAPLSRKIGRKTLLLIGLGGLSAACLCSPLLFSAKMPYLLFIFSSVVAVSIACVWVLTLPMLADACDYDEILTGRRREGLFTAMWNWAIKASIAFFGLAAGLLIDWSGFNAKLALQTPETIRFLQMTVALVPIPFFALCMYWTVKFPISPSVIRRMREEKEQESRRLSAIGQSTPEPHRLDDAAPTALAST